LVCVRPVLGPRQDRHTRPTTVCQRGPSARSHGGLTARSLISGLHSTAFTLAVYASPTKSPGPAQDALLAAGQLYHVGLATQRVPTNTSGVAPTASLPSFQSLAGCKNDSAQPPGRPGGQYTSESGNAGPVGCNDWSGGRPVLRGPSTPIGYRPLQLAIITSGP